MRTFNVVVVANNTDWPTLWDKMAAVRQFYAPVCDLRVSIEHTRMQPVFNNSYPGLAPLYVLDRGWYDVNVTMPMIKKHPDVDIIIFIVSEKDRHGLPTYSGLMDFNNLGPWEITMFVNGEGDSIFKDGRNYGSEFEVITEHELSHAFYYYCGKQDDTHLHFPGGRNDVILPDPTAVLRDFDFGTRYAILEWCKDKLLTALVSIGFLSKKNVSSIAEPRAIA